MDDKSSIMSIYRHEFDQMAGLPSGYLIARKYPWMGHLNNVLAQEGREISTIS